MSESDSKLSTLTGEGTRVKPKDDEFYMSFVTFEVQGVLFRVPVEAFTTRSEVFRDMFALPSGEENAGEGLSDELPVVLNGIEADDFRALLRYLYPKLRGMTIELSQKEWIAVHALAHMWGFEEAKETSKSFIVDMEDSVTKLQIGSKFEYDVMLRKAYKELAYRPKPLSIGEAMRIGIELTTHVAQIREVQKDARSSVRALTSLKTNRTYCPLCEKRTDSITHYSDFDGFFRSGEKCATCDVEFYGDRTTIDDIISKRVDDKIMEIVPTTSTQPRSPCFEKVEDDDKVEGFLAPAESGLEPWGLSSSSVDAIPKDSS